MQEVSWRDESLSMIDSGYPIIISNHIQSIEEEDEANAFIRSWIMRVSNLGYFFQDMYTDGNYSPEVIINKMNHNEYELTIKNYANFDGVDNKEQSITVPYQLMSDFVSYFINDKSTFMSILVEDMSLEF